MSLKPDGNFVFRHEGTPTGFAAHPYQVRQFDSVPTIAAYFSGMPTNGAFPSAFRVDAPHAS
jgi:hypothetical protein